MHFTGQGQPVWPNAPWAGMGGVQLCVSDPQGNTLATSVWKPEHSLGRVREVFFIPRKYHSGAAPSLGCQGQEGWLQS